jgi:hypothetical protein
MGSELDVMELIHIAEKLADIQQEMLDNFQHLTWLIPESRNCALNSSREIPVPLYEVI